MRILIVRTGIFDVYSLKYFSTEIKDINIVFGQLIRQVWNILVYFVFIIYG